MSPLGVPFRASLRALLLAVVVTTLVVVLARGWQLNRAIEWIGSVDQQQRLVGHMAATSVRLLTTVQDDLLRDRPGMAQRWATELADLRDDLQQLQRLDAVDAGAVGEFDQAFAELESLFDGLTRAAPAGRIGDGPASEHLMQSLRTLSGQAYHYEGHIETLRQQERQRQARWAVFYNAALVALMLLLAGVVWRRLVRPLGRLAATAARVEATGLPDMRVGYVARDEMGLATRSFDAMLDRLARMRHELARALERLRRERQELASIIEGTNAGTWAWNVQTGETRYNERWAGIIGWHLDELQPVSADTWYDHLHPEDMVRASQALRAHCQGEVPFYDCEVRMRHRNGHWVWVHTRGRVFTRSTDHQPEWMYGTHQDITERKALEQTLADARLQAETANRAKTHFLAIMSHELRTPLHALLGIQRLLARDLVGARERDLLHRADQAGQALLDAVNEVLDLARIEAGELALDPVAWQPRALAEELVGVYGLQAQAKGLSLQNDLDAQLPVWLFGDAKRVRQVLTNLLGNAIKFSERGAVVLRWRRQARAGRDWLRLSVIDSGRGIDADRLEQVFEPFVQADPGVMRRHGGSGLGLTIVKQLATLMGGEVGVRSRPGEGSTFWVDLPLIEPGSGDSGLALPPLRVALHTPRPVWRERWARWVNDLGWALHEGAAAEADVHLIDGRDGETLPASTGLRLVLGAPLPQPEADTLHLPLRADGAAVLATLAQALPARQVPAQRWVRRTEVGLHPLHWLAGLHVLVCDDDDTNRHITAALLTAQGATSVVFPHGQQALDWLSRHPDAVDLVLMDVQMPVLDGWQSCQRLRAEPATAALPVIALTAGALANERERAQAAGMNAFLGKPFTPLQLAQTLRDTLPAAVLARVGVAVADAPAAAPAADGAPPPSPVLGDLMGLLLRRDLDALQWVLAREAALVLQLGAARTHALREAVEGLDYAGAVHLLGEVSTP
jgi:PAS domain S-box-containing protein